MSGTYTTKQGQTVTVSCVGIEFYKVSYPPVTKRARPQSFTLTAQQLQVMIDDGRITKR